ncbi:hypothetical protein SO802_026778 [Lithocarpus litseifolius]|uniref:Uncharacterized protein n=1 Tax=Lithocarpus litseifolius TaxID=425828 RepID=A0AAW2C1F2_9ROSI
MVVKNLLPIYHKHLFAQYFPNFKALIVAGIQVEDVVNNGILKNEESYSSNKDVTHTTNWEVVNVVNFQASSTVNPKPRRKFDELNMTLSEALEKLQAKGLLNCERPRQKFWGVPLKKERFLECFLGNLSFRKPLDPKGIPHPMPRSYNPNTHCKYHQGVGNMTDKCFHLRHDIQDLIDRQVVIPPSLVDPYEFV